MPIEIRGWIQLSYGLKGFVEAILDGNHVFIINLDVFGQDGPIDSEELTDQEDSEFHFEACQAIFDYVKHTKNFPILHIGSHCEPGDNYDCSFE
jgi:hypothetical protein